ncbi:hypothetical protein ZYGR_0N04220 [Zygosaccharomyces rouxii]|uniref:Uncharacterized protein n=1 Tax=Zygosaccharomyces rouxii TaxID=4956 RepID=A0A1Q2ZZZ5_ZYGRO|nr:hypothetical protein ZYGR_0N04220 [Zygosaccharomyces rouxii]
MFRSKRPDPFTGLYEEAHRREQARKGTFLTQVVNSDGANLLDVADRAEKSPSIKSSSRASARKSHLGEFASPFRLESNEKDAEKRRLQRFPTVSPNSVFSKVHPKELGYRTMGRGSRRAKDIQFPIYLRENEARQDQLLTEVEIREQKLAYIKNSQIVHDYTEGGKKKSGAKKGVKSTKSKPSAKSPGKPAIKAVSKSNDELETIPDNEVGSQYTFETLPDGASYDYLIETEEVPAGAAHGKMSSKPVKLVRKGEKESKKEEATPDAESFNSKGPSPEPATPEAGLKSKAEEQAGNELKEVPETSSTSKKAESKVESSAKDVVGDEKAEKAEKTENLLDRSEPLDAAKDSADKATRFKEGPVEKIPDTVIGDETLEIAPEKGAHGAAADVKKGAKEAKKQSESDEGVVEATKVAAGEPESYEGAGVTENDSTPGPMVDDVHSDVSVTSPPVDYAAVPRVVTFPEVEKKRSIFSIFGRKKKSQNRAPNPLATPENPEILVKTDREGFLSKAVYDKVKYENHKHSEWLTEFISSEKKRYEEKQVDYDNRLEELKKEVEKLEESMQEIKDDANELIEIRHGRLSKKFLESTQQYIEKKNAIFHETKAIQDQKDKETDEIKHRQEEVQKEIAALNAEKDNIHREFIGWTNRLADYSAHLDAKMYSLHTLQQKHTKTQAQIDELSHKKAVLEKEMAAHKETHAKNTKAVEKHANKEYLPKVHEIDDKISNLLGELSVIKQESANEKVKLGSITKKLESERQAHEEQLKLEAEERERKEKDLLGKQREEHEAVAAGLKKQHEEELRKMKQDYEKRLQELKEHQSKQTAEAEATKARAAENETHGGVATHSVKSSGASGASGTDGIKSTGAKSTGAKSTGAKSTDAKSTGAKSTDAKPNATKSGVGATTKSTGPQATDSTSGKVHNPFTDSGVTKSKETRELTDNQGKPSGVVPYGSNVASGSTANDNRNTKQNPSASRESSLFDYETEEEIRSVY